MGARAQGHFLTLIPGSHCMPISCISSETTGPIDLFHIVSAHAYIGHVTRYFPIIGETLQRWGKRILSH